MASLLCLFALVGCGGGGGGSLPDAGPPPTSTTPGPAPGVSPAPAPTPVAPPPGITLPPLPELPLPSSSITGNPGSGDLTATLTPTSNRHVVTSVEPSNIQPGEPLTGKMYVTDTLFGEGADCNPTAPIDQVSTFTTGWPFHKVPAGYNYWTASAAGVLDGASILISGTQRKSQVFLCGPPRLVVTDAIDFQISGADTAKLANGCYQLSFVNQTLVSPENGSGTIAEFTVGDGTCGAGQVNLFVAFAWAGSLGAGGGALTGRDFAMVNGPGASRVGKICISADWKATTQLTDPSSLALEWNGQVFPFTNDTQAGIFWTGVDRGGTQLAVEDGKIKVSPGNYFETVRIEHCEFAKEMSLAFNPPVLSLATPGMMLAIEHGATATAYDVDGHLLATAQTKSASDDTVTKVDLMEAAVTSVPVP